MGQEILYCFRCQTRIVGADFAKGAAYQVGNNVSCSKCAKELLNTLPPKDRENLIAQMFKATQERKSGSTSMSLQALGAPLSSSSTRMKTAAPNPPSERRKSGDTARRLWSQQSRHSMRFAGLGVLLLAVVLLVMLSSGGKQAPTGVSTKILQPTTEARTPAPEHDEVRKAREFARTHPEDIEGQLAAWRGALLAVDRTPGADAAQKELERLLILQKDAVKNALQVLDVQARPYLAGEEFVAAADILRAARSRFTAPEWTLAVDRKIDEARRSAEALLPALKVKAADAQRTGAADEIRAIQARVRKWGHPDLARELDAAIADATKPADPNPVPAPAPAPGPAASKDLAAYLPRWEAAFGRAAAGDAAGASQELASAVQALTDTTLKTQGTEDLEALRRAAAAIQEIRETIARTPKGQKVSLERWNDAGSAERVDGTVLGSEPGRLLLRTEAGLIPLDVGELTLAGISALFAARPAKKPGDERSAALLALLGGDVERAAKWKVELPDRWRNFAPKAAAAMTSGREADARRLFAEAEDAAGDPARVAAALANYKTLLAEYSTTAFAVRNRPTLGGRPTLGKEYLYFPDTLKGSGSFSLAKAGKMDSVWVSDRDSDASAVGNFVELSFTALPDLEYKLWVYAAGCCLETFSFGVQGTEMVLPSSRSTPAEPGGAASIAIRPPLSLKKTHAMHTGPKSPARWEWIPVPLPKYAVPGVKVVRLITDQQGFAVAYASVSALTSNSPRESEMKELEKARSRRAPVSEKEIPGLLAYWRLDEGGGAVVNDATGRMPAGSIQGATWTPGRSGSGLRFDGGNSWVELPSTAELDKLAEGSYSVMAWFKPDDLPPGQGEVNNAAYGIVLRAGRHTGLHYNSSGAFTFNNWLLRGDDPKQSDIVNPPTKAFPPGVFYHVAGVFNRGIGKSLVYVNGKLEASGQFDPAARAMSYDGSPWRLGIGGPHYPKWRWCAKGVIDEVRFYNRALGASEVEILYRSSTSSPSSKAPAEARPWKPIFDGKTQSCLNPACFSGWVAKDGCISNVSGVDNAAQLASEYGDGDLRFQFESRGNSVFWFIVRQSGLNGFRVDLRQLLGEELNKGEHELIFILRGSSVTATLDGKPAKVEPVGSAPAKGLVQFNSSKDGTLRIRSIESRDPK
jgi:hypothetical protein